MTGSEFVLFDETVDKSHLPSKGSRESCHRSESASEQPTTSLNKHSTPHLTAQKRLITASARCKVVPMDSGKEGIGLLIAHLPKVAEYLKG